MQGSYLNEVLSFCFGDEWLQLGSGEGVDETSFRDNKQEHLSAGKDREFVCLVAPVRMSCRGRQSQVLTFFMMPAFLLEKVM